MFASLDYSIFPDECVVLEIVPHTRYVYPIFKNGSSSLMAEFGKNQISIKDLANVPVIDVIVRDPHQRFLSGVKTFLAKINPSLDKKTVLYFVEHYLYLNRHFCPQLYWLINLARFTNAKFRLLPMSSLSQFTGLHRNESLTDCEIVEYFQTKTKVKFFNEVDEALTVNLINQTVTLKDILSVVKSNYADLYTEMFYISQDVNRVLFKT